MSLADLKAINLRTIMNINNCLEVGRYPNQKLGYLHSYVKGSVVIQVLSSL